MENEQFKKMLKAVGLNKKDFSIAANIPLTTIAGWTVSGKNNIPGWVEPFLECMLELKSFKDQNEKNNDVEELIKKLTASQEDLAEKVNRLTGGQSL